MEQVLDGKRVAILVADGFEQDGLAGPKEALERCGAVTVIVSASPGTTVHSADGAEIFVDQPVTSVSPEDYDALLLPGAGDRCSEVLRASAPAAELMRTFSEQGKPVAECPELPGEFIDRIAASGAPQQGRPLDVVFEEE